MARTDTAEIPHKAPSNALMALLRCRSFIAGELAQASDPPTPDEMENLLGDVEEAIEGLGGKRLRRATHVSV